MRRLMILFLCAFALMLTACATSPLPVEPTVAPTPLASQPSPTVTPTIIPTVIPAVTPTELPPALTCADLDGAWGAEEWAGVLFRG